MTDVAIRATAVVSAPDDYTIPGAQELLPKSVSANMDGSAAASTWYPCLQILDPGGHVMSSAKSTTGVAAGGSASVTWFPHVGGTGSGSLSNPGLMAVRVNIVGNITVPEGDPGVFVTWGEAPLDNGTPAPFWNAGTPLRLTAPVSGYYLSIGNLEWSVIGAGNAPAYVGHYIYKNGAASPSYLYEFNSAEVNIGTSYNLQGGSHGIIQLNAGDYLETLAYNFNNGAVNRDLIDLRPAENHYSSWSLILVAAT